MFIFSIMQVNLDDVLKISRDSVLVIVLKVGEKEEVKPGLFKRDASYYCRCKGSHALDSLEEPRRRRKLID